MAFQKTTILSTKTPVFGPNVAGQIIPVPTGRLDKVSVYLEPEVSDAAAAEALSVIIELYDVDGGLPTGAVLASDSIRLSDIAGGRLYNFRIEAPCPTVSAIVLRCNGDADNHASWRYVQSTSSTEYALSSLDGGSSWAQDPNRKMSYAAYSLIDGAVSEEDQTATIQAGDEVVLTDDTDADFLLAEFDRTRVEGTGVGATVVVDFGNFVVTLVLDQSGSMTWNDREGVRFDFLKAYVDDIESNLSLISGSEATYSLVKFRSRKIGRMTLSLLAGDSAAAAFAGVRIVRKTGSPVTGPTDGTVIFEGVAEEILDGNLSTGSTYYYGAFMFDDAVNFSDAKLDSAIPLAASRPPVGAAGFGVVEDIVEEFCATLGDLSDVGNRRIVLSWVDPANDDPLTGYDGFYLTRRTDRFPETPEDGTPLKPAGTSAIDPFYKIVAAAASPTLIPTSPGKYVYADFDPALDAVSGMTYYYSLFTANSSGVRVLAANARRASITVSGSSRPWLKAEVPLDTAASHCFNGAYEDTPPNIPTVAVTEGNGEILLGWTPGSSSGTIPPAARYEIYYGEQKYPEGKINDLGQLDYDGDLLFNGEETTFTHRGLDNGQPHFYVLVAYDRASNQATGVQAFGRPSDEAVDTIPPAAVAGFSAEPVNATTIRLSWIIPALGQTSISGYFGDTIRVLGTVTYSDLDPTATSATFEIVEEGRFATPFDPTVEPVLSQVLDFSKDSRRATLISGTLLVPPSLILRNQLRDVSATFHAALRVKDAGTGDVLMEVVTPTARATLSNPFSLSVGNEPEQTVSRRIYALVCDAENTPEVNIELFPGVYVRTGEPFRVVLEASFRGAPLGGPLNVSFRVLDKETNDPSPIIRLPGSDSAGTVVLQLDDVEDEVLDRSGEPTGETRTRTALFFNIPPQDVPGDYILEVTGSYLGYEQTATLEMHFESSLNIDMKVAPFSPDGSSTAEQEAFVYLGPPDADILEKTPVADLTVVDWELVILSAPRKRPLFSQDSVPGSGIKSYTRGGVAKNVLFGPGSEVEPPTGESCTDGELFAIKAKASYLGMTTEAYGFVELLPFDLEQGLNRIFMRAVPGQPGANGTTSGFNQHIVFADGDQESQWEVIARPELDGVATDRESGQYFRDRVTTLGGQVPSIEDGRVVTLVVESIQGRGIVDASNVIVKTNLSPDGQAGWAKARIESGRALFTLSCNARVHGTVLEEPESGDASNPVYDADSLFWEKSPIVFALHTSIVMEVDGRPVVFTGGGNNVFTSTPPAYLSLEEPLEA